MVSVLPKRYQQGSAEFDEFKLYAANDSVINTYGRRLMCIDFGLRRVFKYSFIVADVTSPIIGADFLVHFGLTVNLRDKRIIDPNTTLATKGELGPARIVGISTLNARTDFNGILKRFSEITTPQICPRSSNECQTVHYTYIDNRPTCC